MYAMTNKTRNFWIDYEFRGVSYTPPTTFYVGLFYASAGQSPRSTAVTTGQTTVPASPNGHLYVCTTAGTTGSGEPTWPTTVAGTVTDGTAVWTEMTADFEANTSLTEVSGNAYARVAVTSSTTNWSATNGATTTTNPSTGTTGTTSNNVAITFPTTTGSWGLVCGWGLFDASTSGNLRWFEIFTPTAVASGISPGFAISGLSIQLN